MTEETPSFSVVIPCYNEEKYVGELLEDISSQTLRPKKVIVADSRSTDRTTEVAARFKSRLSIEIATSKIRSPGAARNAGAKLAKGDYIIFIDADMRLPKTAFEQTLQATERGKVDYITPLFSTPGHHPIDQIAVKMINFDIRLGLTSKAHLPGIGGYMCVRNSLNKALGGFAAESRGEDIDYLVRMKHHEISHVVLTNLVVETSNRRLVKDGRLMWMLNFIPHRWRLSKYVVKPILRKAGKEKRFGEF